MRSTKTVEWWLEVRLAAFANLPMTAVNATTLYKDAGELRVEFVHDVREIAGRRPPALRVSTDRPSIDHPLAAWPRRPWVRDEQRELDDLRLREAHRWLRGELTRLCAGKPLLHPWWLAAGRFGLRPVGAERWNPWAGFTKVNGELVSLSPTRIDRLTAFEPVPLGSDSDVDGHLKYLLVRCAAAGVWQDLFQCAYAGCRRFGVRRVRRRQDYCSEDGRASRPGRRCREYARRDRARAAEDPGARKAFGGPRREAVG